MIIKRNNLEYRVRGPHREKSKGKDKDGCVLIYEVVSPDGGRRRVEVPEFIAEPPAEGTESEAAGTHGIEQNKKRREYLESIAPELAVDKAIGVAALPGVASRRVVSPPPVAGDPSA